MCEVSSFQDETLEHFRPSLFIWTNIAEDHQDRHGSMDKHFKAKWHLVKQLSQESLYVGSTVLDMIKKLGLSIISYVIEAQMVMGLKIFQQDPQRENYGLIETFWIDRGWDQSQLIKSAEAFKALPIGWNVFLRLKGSASGMIRKAPILPFF